MLNPNINYPYPVIRDYAEDYKTTIFKGEMVVNMDPDGYLIRPSFDVPNAEIRDYICEGKLTYAIEVQSPATWYRRLFVIKDNKTVRLEPVFLHERVELTPCIVATEDIPGFTNADFEEEYRALTFDVSEGDVIAIGEKRIFDALSVGFELRS